MRPRFRVRGRPLPSPVRAWLAPHLPAADLDRARLVDGLPAWTRLAPIRIRAITLGGTIHLREGVETESASTALLAHELCHVRQWRELGPARFLSRYLGAYLRNRMRGMGRAEAYRRIPLEEEAVRFAESVMRG